MANLLKKSINSYQSISDIKIECCICLNEENNDKCYISDCKHSWCLDCNEKLFKYKISNCPICNQEFEPILKKGKWIRKNNKIIWIKGVNDSKKKIILKKIQQKILNLYFRIYIYRN